MGTAEDRNERDRPDSVREDRSEDTQGELSEVSGMDPDESETPIAPGDATAAYPESESGHPQEGEVGPDAVPRGNREGRRA